MSFVFKYFLASFPSLTCNCFVFRYFLASFRMRSCVFNNILASVVSFLIYFQFPLSPSAPPSRHLLRRVSKRPSPTTMCPQNNHHCRLSQVPGFVKHKMRIRSNCPNHPAAPGWSTPKLAPSAGRNSGPAAPLWGKAHNEMRFNAGTDKPVSRRARVSAFENGWAEGALECGSASYRRSLELHGGSSAAALHDPLRIFMVSGCPSAARRESLSGIIPVSRLHDKVFLFGCQMDLMVARRGVRWVGSVAEVVLVA